MFWKELVLNSVSVNYIKNLVENHFFSQTYFTESKMLSTEYCVIVLCLNMKEEKAAS